MCKYCSHLKELRAEDKKLYEKRMKLMDKAFLRKEALLKWSLPILEAALCYEELDSDLLFDLIGKIHKELEREVL